MGFYLTVLHDAKVSLPNISQIFFLFLLNTVVFILFHNFFFYKTLLEYVQWLWVVYMDPDFLFPVSINQNDIAVGFTVAFVIFTEYYF